MEKYFYEAFKNLERLAPGSDLSTKKAMSLLQNKEQNLKILDIGCGNGIHTILLAKYFCNSTIIAVDNNDQYLKNLNSILNKNNLSNRVTVLNMSMFDMNFKNQSFDLIWAEGSIYIVGFEEGLNQWKKYLKKGGYLICSEISWITDEPHKESYNFWNTAYPEIDTIENKVLKIAKAGYNFKSSFILPKEDWLSSYYIPLEKNLDAMKIKYIDNKSANKVINMIESEITLYNNHNEDYSYVFYLMEK